MAAPDAQLHRAGGLCGVVMHCGGIILLLITIIITAPSAAAAHCTPIQDGQVSGMCEEAHCGQ